MDMPVDMNKPLQVIGYWMSEKKSQKLNWKEFGNVCRKFGFDLVKIDLSYPLEDQGPFTVIIHKLTDVIAKAVQGDTNARDVIHRFESYLERNPEIGVIDPLQNVRKLLERHNSYSTINNNGLENLGIFIPNFVELTSQDVEINLLRLREAGVTFPFVCKPTIAHGSKNAHQMAIIFNEEGVRDCFPPCVAQSFVSHNAVLYKIFFVGEEYQIVERPSLKNFYPSDQETIFFDSHDVSKADSTSSLSILDPVDLEKLLIRNSLKLPTGENHSLPNPHHLLTPCPPDSVRIKALRKVLRETLGMKLLGVDLVWELGTGRYAIIDINVYPGYDGYPNFFESLMRCILKTIEEKKTEGKFQKRVILDNITYKATRSDTCKSIHHRKHCNVAVQDKSIKETPAINGDCSMGSKEIVGMLTSESPRKEDSTKVNAGKMCRNPKMKDDLNEFKVDGCDRIVGQELDDSGFDTGDSSDEKKKKELMKKSAQSFPKNMPDNIQLS